RYLFPLSTTSIRPGALAPAAPPRVGGAAGGRGPRRGRGAPPRLPPGGAPRPRPSHRPLAPPARRGCLARAPVVPPSGGRAPRRPVWLGPLVAAAATAMVLILVVLPVLPRIVPADPMQRYVRAVVSEHSRTLMWGARRGDVLPAALPWLTQETGIGLNQFFVG